ncbi:hypothetical protein EE612_019635, partial [Oryza sativa]
RSSSRTTCSRASSPAASRCVCKAWRAVIDTRRLLRADLLPLSLAGIYINFHEMHRSVFLSRPSSTRPAISGMFTDYTPNDNLVEDHCNGLLLLKSTTKLTRNTSPGDIAMNMTMPRTEIIAKISRKM